MTVRSAMRSSLFPSLRVALRHSWLACLLAVTPGLAAAAGQERGVGNAASDAPLVSALEFEEVRRSKVYRALRTEEPIVIDGVLDERVWQEAEVGGHFYQTEPRTGHRATEATEFRIAYDEDHLYVAVVCHQQGPVMSSELGRDFSPVDGDQIGVFIDTFDDDRNGFLFQTNPGGAQRDQQIAGGARSAEWDGAFTTAARIQAPGWTAEFAIPFKTLRFTDGAASQRWGLNLFRIIRYKNEYVIWAPAPRPFGILDAFIAGTLEGVEGIRQGRNLHIKPFAISTYRPDVRSESPGDLDVGMDAKYGVTAGLTLDLTLNTDFSHVEADTQQVNLTRFSLFFPEKREFFLENYGLFSIGGSGRVGGLGNAGVGSNNDIVPFFSRRIGLSEEGVPIPIRGGARLTGRIRGTDLGVLTMRTAGNADVPADTWTILRVKRNVMAHSDVGAFFFNRELSDRPDWNRIAGVDANLRFLRRRLAFSGFAMRSQDPSGRDDNTSAQFETTYGDNRYALKASYLTIEDGFRTDFGFVARPSIRLGNLFGGLRFRPRSRVVRDLFPQADVRYITDQAGRLVTRDQRLGMNVTFTDGGTLTINRNLHFERIDEPWSRRGLEIPVGDYSFDNWRVAANTSRGRRLFVSGAAGSGGFWTGTLRDASAGVGYRHSAHLTATANWSRNWVELASGRFDTDLLVVRLDLAFSPRMFLETLTQYNTDVRRTTSKVRFRFIHHSLSDLYVVYEELRGIRGNEALTRALSVKITHLLGF